MIRAMLEIRMGLSWGWPAKACMRRWPLNIRASECRRRLRDVPAKAGCSRPTHTLTQKRYYNCPLTKASSVSPSFVK